MTPSPSYDSVMAEYARRQPGLVVKAKALHRRPLDTRPIDKGGSSCARAQDDPAGPSKKKRGMNKWESEYAAMLGLDPDVLWYGWEFIKFRLADKTYYTPDFIVIRREAIEAVEVKGFARDDAIVKFKCAAEKFTWLHWIMVTKQEGAWVAIRHYPPKIDLWDATIHPRPDEGASNKER